MCICDMDKEIGLDLLDLFRLQRINELEIDENI